MKVQFTGSTSSLVSVINGTLTINSNAVNQPTTTIALSGIYQEYSEQSPNNVYSEPSLQQIVNAFGYTTVVANPNQETVDGDYVELGQEGQGVAVGQETLSGYWEQADSNAPVTVETLAAFHKESAQDTLGAISRTPTRRSSITTRARPPARRRSSATTRTKARRFCRISTARRRTMPSHHSLRAAARRLVSRWTAITATIR